jgi:O-antigen/teichoic acid export membrane protein
MFEKIKRLISHAVVYGLGNTGNRLVGFLLIPVYSRYLTPEDYGVLALVGMFGQILFTLTNMGQSSALFRTYFSRDDAERRETVLTTSLWLVLTLSFPISLLALVLSRPLASLLTGSPAYTDWVMLAIGGIVFKTLLRLPFAVLRAREQSRRYAGFAFAQTAVSLVLAIVFVVGLHLGGRGILLSQLLAEVLLCSYLVPTMVRGLTLKFSSQDARDLLGYGLALVPAGMLSFLLHLSDRYFLKHFVSLHAVGLYSLGYRFGESLQFVMSAFELAWPQFLYGHVKSPEASRLYARVCTYYLAVMGFVWLVVSLLAEEIVTIMAHSSFHAAYRVVPWIAGAFLFQGLAFVGNVGMKLHRQIKYRLLISAITTGVNLSLNYLLIPPYGMMGAAIAALSSFVLQFSVQILVGYRFYPVPYEYNRISRLALVGLGLYGVGTWIAWSSIWTALAGKGLLLLCAPLLLYVSGFFEPGELARLRESLWSLREQPGALLQTRSLNK